MKYSLRVINNFRDPVEILPAGKRVISLETKVIEASHPHTFISIPGMNGICFMDIGGKPIGAFLESSADILIRYAGKVYQFGSALSEDSEIRVIIDREGRIQLRTFYGYFMTQVFMPRIILQEEEN
jgi:hypothetical protein